MAPSQSGGGMAEREVSVWASNDIVKTLEGGQQSKQCALVETGSLGQFGQGKRLFGGIEDLQNLECPFHSLNALFCHVSFRLGELLDRLIFAYATLVAFGRKGVDAVDTCA